MYNSFISSLSFTSHFPSHLSFPSPVTERIYSINRSSVRLSPLPHSLHLYPLSRTFSFPGIHPCLNRTRPVTFFWSHYLYHFFPCLWWSTIQVSLPVRGYNPCRNVRHYSYILDTLSFGDLLKLPPLCTKLMSKLLMSSKNDETESVTQYSLVFSSVRLDGFGTWSHLSSPPLFTS